MHTLVITTKICAISQLECGVRVDLPTLQPRWTCPWRAARVAGRRRRRRARGFDFTAFAEDSAWRRCVLSVGVWGGGGGSTGGFGLCDRTRICVRVKSSALVLFLQLTASRILFSNPTVCDPLSSALLPSASASLSLSVSSSPHHRETSAANSHLLRVSSRARRQVERDYIHPLIPRLRVITYTL